MRSRSKKMQFVRVLRTIPESVQIKMEQLVSRELPVQVNTAGKLADGTELFGKPSVKPSEVNVVGILEDNNKLSLLSGGCGTGLCLMLALVGQGEDTNGDGLMDAYSGSWSFTIMLAGVQPFGVTGGYSVARSAE